jgi:hypothetical protein
MLVRRRQLLVGSLGAAALSSTLGRIAAATTTESHRLSFYHIHTAERLTAR